jgi:hypothetical protein
MITAQWSVWESSVLGPCPDLLEALQVRVVRKPLAGVEEERLLRTWITIGTSV